MHRRAGVLIGSGSLGAAVGALTIAAWTSPQSALFTLCLAGLSAVTPDPLWSTWSFAPQVIVPLVLLAFAYGLGMSIRMRRHGREQAWRETLFFATGLALLVVALVSPLCRMAATVAWAHMVQHVILVALAPPLLVLGASGPVLSTLFAVWTRERWRASPTQRAPHIVLAAGIYGAMIWLWHVPALYQAALLNVVVHLLLYVSLVASALFCWSAVIASARQSEQTAGAVLILLGTLMHTGMLGALLAFASTPWFPLMAAGGAAWGLTPLGDQQLAGLIMWVPMGAIYLLAALVLTAVGLTRMGEPRLDGVSPSGSND